MNTLLTLVLILVAVAAGGWVLRFAGQKITNNAPTFRDMPFAVAFGYVLGTCLLAFSIWYFFQPTQNEAGVPNAGVVFFRWAAQFFIISAIAAFLFRALGRTVGTRGSRKLFRQMPLTASFGVLVVIIYAFTAIFAAWLAPHGQEEVFAKVNVLPGGNAATGGDPLFPLGTDQIGRDLLSRLIYGAQNLSLIHI